MRCLATQHLLYFEYRIQAQQIIFDTGKRTQGHMFIVVLSRFSFSHLGGHMAHSIIRTVHVYMVLRSVLQIECFCTPSKIKSHFVVWTCSKVDVPASR